MRNFPVWTILSMLLLLTACGNDAITVAQTPPTLAPKPLTTRTPTATVTASPTSTFVPLTPLPTQKPAPLPNLCDGLITDLEPHPMQPIDKPASGETYVDPSFGTTIRRISDADDGVAIKPMYSTIAAWNADESYLLLYETGRGHRLYDGFTYQFIRYLDEISPPDLEQVFWSPTEPDILYYFDSALKSLLAYDVTTNEHETVRTFDQCDFIDGGDNPMYISWDGNSFGALCGDDHMFSYHLDSDTVYFAPTQSQNAPQPAPGGERYFLDGDVYDGELNFMRSLELANPHEHSVMGQLEDGTDVYYAVAFDGEVIGALVANDMNSAEIQSRIIIGPETGYPYPPSGIHVSAMAYKRPGWVFASMVGYDYDGQALLDNELVLANTNPGSEQVCRLGHHRSWGRNGPLGYWAEPHVVASPSGTRILYGSDWGGGNSVDAYVLELPAYVAPEK